MEERGVYIVSACRSAIGSFGGSLLDTAPAELGKQVAVEALKRSGIDLSQEVDEVIVGNVLGAGHGMNIARQVCLKSGLKFTTPAYTVNKVCGSGLKAVTLAAAEISQGSYDCALAGGVESMSQANYVLKSARWGARMGNSEVIDLMINDGLTDVFNSCHMGITAENLAAKYNITREEQDRFSFESQTKAQAAIEAGHFKSEISPITLYKRGTPSGSFEIDEYPRKGVSEASLAALKPAFKRDGTVTAGNASGINDGAAFLVLMSGAKLKALRIKPMAQVLGWASAGVEPEIMGIGPVFAVKKLLNRHAVSIDKLDLIEANEAFAVQALAVSKLLEWDSAKVNICGGAIALGHPIGASGARILVTLVHQMKRLSKELGLATLCVGGGQGIAVLVRNLD